MGLIVDRLHTWRTMLRGGTPQVRLELRGRAWFVEHDLRAGAQLRLDKSGRALLMALRHLGRIAEVRGCMLGRGGRARRAQ